MMVRDNREGNASPGADRDKQIEEMAKFACINCDWGCNGECVNCREPAECVIAKPVAEALYNAGYRLASEVAREIIDILKSAGIDKWRYPVIEDIEKKYLEEK